MRRAAAVLLQVALGFAVAYAVWRSVAGNWERLTTSGVALAFRPLPALAAALVVLATYALLIESWRRVLAGWSQRMPYAVATRIWTVSNLGRYLPGKVWAVAGMAALAQRAGVAPWAAAGSAIILQALAVGTAAALVAATVPGAASATSLALAFGAAAATVVALGSPAVTRALFRLSGRLPVEGTPPLGARPIVAGALATLGAWVAYGVALKLWAAATLADGAAGLDLATAAGAFTASYVVGLLALFAPGGLVVREGLLFTLLQGHVGPGDALALAVGSRLLLTVTEIAAALVGLTWPAGRTDAQRPG